MSVADVKIYRYRLPFTKPLRLSNQTIFDRQGFIICLEDKTGYVGWGEIAPFPGLHNENVSAAEAQTLFLQKKLAGFTLPENLEAFHITFEERFGKLALWSSVRCGLEMALLNLMADRQHQPLCALLSAFPRETVSLNGLVAENSTGLSGQIQTLVAEGYRAIKLKVGRKSLQDDIARVKTARELLPPAVALRLDANRAWDFPRAIAFGKAVADCQIEYIEEPLQKPPDLEKFYDQTGLPLALDESLSHISPLSFPTIKGLAALVLKPGVLGGIQRAVQFARLAAENHLKAVISSAFESGVGLSAAVNIAACVNSADIPAGLDTYKWLAEDVLAEPFSAINGAVNVDVINRRSKNIRLEKLLKIG